MTVIADVFLFLSSFGAAFYCHVLAKRLRRFSTLEGEMGGAIALLSVQVDDMTRALATAQQVSGQAQLRLVAQTERAEALAVRLELLIAALHDLPEPAAAAPADPALPARILRRRLPRVPARAVA